MKNTILFIITALYFSSCKVNYTRTQMGQVVDQRLNEVSGIVSSFMHKDHFWVINDSGAEPYLYLIDAQGALVSTVHVENASNNDWEALAINNDQDRPCIYIGDIGDNRGIRQNIQIYQVPEPEIGDSTAKASIMSIKYQEGPRDAETLMFDHQKKELIIVSKRERRPHVYQFPFLSGNHEIPSLGRINHTFLTGGDIAENGDVLIKNYWRIFLWSAKPNQSIVQRITKTKPKKVKYKKEIQGEAICWSHDAQAFYTISEMSLSQVVPFFEYKK